MPRDATRYSLQERLFIASEMYVFKSPSLVRRNFVKRFYKEPPSRLTICRINNLSKWIKTGAITDNIAGVSGRHRSIRNEENIVAVQRALEQNPKNSIRRLKNQLAVPISRASCQRIIAKSLGLKPYRIQRHQALRPQDKEKRRIDASILFAMSVVSPAFENLLIFSDEATFRVSGPVNRRNCIIWGAQRPTEIREHVRDSPKLNVWCAVTPDGIIGP